MSQNEKDLPEQKAEVKVKPAVPNPVQPAFDEQSAMHLCRSFWLSYNNINMYSDNHPQAKRAVESFHEQLSHQMMQHPRILFHIEQDGFFCGTWRMDRELRIQRLIERLKSSGIDAITFEPSLTSRGLGFFMTILVDVKNFRTAKEVEGALNAAEAHGIRINRHKYSSPQVITDIGTVSAQKAAAEIPEIKPLAAQAIRRDIDEILAENERDNEDVDVEFVPGDLDLGEISSQTLKPAGREKQVHTWQDLTDRLNGEIIQFKGAAESTARFDRFYEALESLILRFLLVSSPPDEESGELNQLSARMEEFDWKLLSELDGPLREHQLLEAVGGRLKDRFVNRVALLWADTVWQTVQPLDEAGLPAFFSRVESDLLKSKSPQVFLQSLLYLLDERGLPDNLFALIWERLVRRGTGEKAVAKAPDRLKLPKDIETRKEILRDMETEMYRHNRYTSPFSCLSISLLGVRSEPSAAIRPFTEEELSALFQFLATELVVSLRKLDRVGSLGPMRQNYLLILLPMTDVTGAVVLLERLENRAENWKIVSQNGFFYPVLLFSSFTYNADKVKDIKALLSRIRSKHRKKGQYMSKNVLKLLDHQS